MPRARETFYLPIRIDIGGYGISNRISHYSEQIRIFIVGPIKVDRKLSASSHIPLVNYQYFNIMRDWCQKSTHLEILKR